MQLFGLCIFSVRDSCKSLQMVFKNGRIECTDGYHLGSICRFRPTGTKQHTEMRSKCIKNKRGFLSWKRISNQATKTEEGDKQTIAPGGLKNVNKQSPAEIRGTINGIIFLGSITYCSEIYYYYFCHNLWQWVPLSLIFFLLCWFTYWSA